MTFPSDLSSGLVPWASPPPLPYLLRELSFRKTVLFFIGSMLFSCPLLRSLSCQPRHYVPPRSSPPLLSSEKCHKFKLCPRIMKPEPVPARLLPLLESLGDSISLKVGKDKGTVACHLVQLLVLTWLPGEPVQSHHREGDPSPPQKLAFEHIPPILQK